MKPFLVILLVGFFSNLPLACSDSDELYNTALLKTDLGWTMKEGEVMWTDQSGKGLKKDGTIRTLEICQPDHYLKDYWTRSPYIDVRSAKRVFLEITFTISKCDSCRESFTIYNYQAQSDIANPDYPPWDESRYKKIDVVAAHNQYDQNRPGSLNAMETKIFPINNVTRKGMYIAIRDQGGCISIIKIRLLYNYCPQTTYQLVNYPRTVSGPISSSLTKAEGQCVANAVGSDQVPLYWCNANGEWSVNTGSCSCGQGYTLLAGKCQACSTDHYKSFVGNNDCIRCPANSEALQTGSTMCRCSNDHYRADHESNGHSCTKPPSAPRNLKNEIAINSVSISWMAPKDTGGRSDIYYSVSCNICDESFISCQKCSDSVKFIPNNVNRLDKTSIFIPNLNQSLFYEIKIFSYNGVSERSQQTAKSAKMRFSISEEVPSAVRDVRIKKKDPEGLFLHWSQPERFKGQIHKYEIQLQPLAPDGKSSLKYHQSILTTSLPFIDLSSTKLSPGTKYEVRICASDDIGEGRLSEKITFVTEEEKSFPVIILVVIVVIGGLICAGIFYLVRRRRRRSELQKAAKKLSTKDDSKIYMTTISAEASVGKTYVDYREPSKSIRHIAIELDPKIIHIHSVVGSGEFGEVCRGKIAEGKNKVIDVAVKRLKDGVGIVDQTNFLKEACTMAQFNHPNIIELKGVVTKKMPAMIITEYMSNGSLDKFLQKRKGDLLLVDLLKMQRGIASGMRYLAEMKYVHRDLAARNILIDSNLCCKVSDFGLSRTLSNDPNATYTTQGGKIALKWTAPECIRYRKFTSASDVWSFGIVMWEIMSYGEKPYWDMHNDDVTECIDNGYRLACPKECPKHLHDAMLTCWSVLETKRPTFDDLHRLLNDYVNSPTRLECFDDVYMTSQPSFTGESQLNLLNNSQLAFGGEEDDSLAVSSLEEWLDLIRMQNFGCHFNSHGIKNLEDLLNFTASDLERLGIIGPEHLSQVDNGINTLRRQFSRHVVSS